jgi:hypothetical protein
MNVFSAENRLRGQSFAIRQEFKFAIVRLPQRGSPLQFSKSIEARGRVFRLRCGADLVQCECSEFNADRHAVLRVSRGIGMFVVEKQTLSFGVALGEVAAGHLVWAVVAATRGFPVGALAGTYAGVGASASINVGTGANILVGGSGRAFSLQPISVEGQQGKSGNPRLRSTLVQVAWLWMRHQPNSALSQWFRARVIQNGGRYTKTAIIALARKLFVALWKYVNAGVVIEGALLTKSSA